MNIEMIKTLGIPMINSKRRYWFVRTVGGLFREEFVEKNFIGINWNEFSDLNSIKKCKDDLDHKFELRDSLAEKLDVNIKTAGKILGQITRFVYEMSEGDIVIIPTENSTKITFGIIESSVYIENFTPEELESLSIEGKCDYLKRRKINWIKTVYRETLDPVLYNMCRAHQTISCCDEYASNIDRLLEPIYFKDGKMYFTARINQAQDIRGYDMYSLYGLAYDTLEIDRNTVSSKVNVQSPGIIQWISENPLEIITIVIAFNAIIGGGKISFLKGYIGEMEFPGLLKWFIDYKQSKVNYEIEMEKLNIERLKILAMTNADPESVQRLMQQLSRYEETFRDLEISIDESASRNQESGE